MNENITKRMEAGLSLRSMKILADKRDRLHILFELQFHSLELENQMLRLTLMSHFPATYGSTPLGKRMTDDAKLFLGRR